MKNIATKIVAVSVATLAVASMTAAPADAAVRSQKWKNAGYSYANVALYNPDSTGLPPGVKATINPGPTQIFASSQAKVEIKAANCTTLEPTGDILQSYISNGTRVTTNSRVRAAACLSTWARF